MLGQITVLPRSDHKQSRYFPLSGKPCVQKAVIVGSTEVMPCTQLLDDYDTFLPQGRRPIKNNPVGKCWNTERKYFSLSETRWWFKAYFSSFSLTFAPWNIKPLNHPIHGCLKLQQNGLLITYLLLHAWSEKFVYVYVKGDYLSYLVTFFHFRIHSISLF